MLSLSVLSQIRYDWAITLHYILQAAASSLSQLFCTPKIINHYHQANNQIDWNKTKKVCRHNFNQVDIWHICTTTRAGMKLNQFLYIGYFAILLSANQYLINQVHLENPTEVNTVVPCRSPYYEYYNQLGWFNILIFCWYMTNLSLTFLAIYVVYEGWYPIYIWGPEQQNQLQIPKHQRRSR